jgi:hypothetical protein
MKGIQVRFRAACFRITSAIGLNAFFITLIPGLQVYEV